MSSKIIISLIALIAILIGILERTAQTYFLYYTIWWFDILMHFLGGLWVSLIAVWFYKAFTRGKSNSRKAYLISVVAILLVGISWEVTEVLFDIAPPGSYVLDTSLDLLMDILGALTGVYIVFRETLKESSRVQYAE